MFSRILFITVCTLFTVYNTHFLQYNCLTLFGIDGNTKMKKKNGFILLLAKQYLYKCKIEKQLPNIDMFRKKLLYRYKIEEYNAQLSCSCSSFSSRWQLYKPFFCRLMLSSTSLFPVCSFIPCLWLTKCWLYQCRMSSSAPCMYVCNEDVLKQMSKK